MINIMSQINMDFINIFGSSVDCQFIMGKNIIIYGRDFTLYTYPHIPHMLSQYLLMHSEAIKATIKEI